MTVDPGSVPKGAIPTLDDDFENEIEAVDRYALIYNVCNFYQLFLNTSIIFLQGEQIPKILQEVQSVQAYKSPPLQHMQEMHS